MNKPKLGFLIPGLGITDRGAEVFVYELAKQLCHDFNICIWVRSTNNSSEMINDLQKSGVMIKQVKCITEENWLAQFLYAFKPFRPILKKFRMTPFEVEMLVFSLMCLPQLLVGNIDIIFPANGVWGVIACKIVRFIRRTPFVYAALGGIDPVVVKLKPNLYITIHPSPKIWIKTHYPEVPVDFISAGVDLKKFSPNGKKANIGLPRPIFLTVSALIPSKRVDLTIKAVGKLKKGSLLIIGDGPLKSWLMEEAKKNLGSGRYLFQSVRYHKLNEYYRAADVFTHSAPGEMGWSMVILEALATNLPVVANWDKDIKRLLGNTGVFCDVSRPDDYVKALKKALTLKVEKRARKLALQYSWERIAMQYKKIINGVIHEKISN